MKPRLPLESQEASYLFQWVQFHEKRFPELQLLFHIPNEAMDWKRRAIMAGQGVRNGVPDYFLPVAVSRPVHNWYRGGLWIELKRMSGGRISPEQRDWHSRLLDQGYAVSVCAGWQEAAQALIDYLALPVTLGEATREPEPELERTSARRFAAKAKPFSPKTQRPSKMLPHPGEAV